MFKHMRCPLFQSESADLRRMSTVAAVSEEVCRDDFGHVRLEEGCSERGAYKELARDVGPRLKPAPC